MCLTSEALLLFLSILPQEIIETSEGRVVIHAEVQDTVWEATGPVWCIDGKATDAALRLTPGEPV